LPGNRTRLWVWLAIFCLGCATLLSAFYANHQQSANADDIVYPYLFSHYTRSDIVLPGQHSNLVKFPLFIVQSLLPYNYLSFSIVNIGLFVISIGLWAFLLFIVIKQRRDLLIISVSLMIILVSSTDFANNFVGTTIRNIEYPISLFFYIVVAQLYVHRVKRILLLVAGGLFAFVCAGDSFFVYGAGLAILITLLAPLVSQLRNRRISASTLQAPLFVIVALIASVIIRKAISTLDIVNYYTGSFLSPHLLPLSHILPSLRVATLQFLDLCGADIFSGYAKSISPFTALSFFIVLCSLVGLAMLSVSWLRHGIRKCEQDIPPWRQIVEWTLANTFWLVICLYIASDLVVTNNHGHFVSAEQERYITFLPLLLCIGLVHILRYAHSRTPKIYKNLGYAPIIIVAFLLVSLPIIRSSFKMNNAFLADAQWTANTAQRHNVQVIASGYWYGAATSFWAHNSLRFVSIAGCNAAAPPFNNRRSWYVPSTKTMHSALVIDRSGADKPYWTCSNERLKQIYGSPTQIITGRGPAQPVMWIYDYDVRSRIRDFTASP